MSDIQGRATDDQMKEEIVSRLLIIWTEHPDLRFMQLLGNVAFRKDPYYVEDYDMIRKVEEYYMPEETE